MNAFENSLGYKLFDAHMEHHRQMWDQSSLIADIDFILNLNWDDLVFTPPHSPRVLECPDAPSRMRSPSFESSISSLPALPVFDIDDTVSESNSDMSFSTRASSHYNSEEYDYI
jgi:hypothetical protein